MYDQSRTISICRTFESKSRNFECSWRVDTWTCFFTNCFTIIRTNSQELDSWPHYCLDSLIMVIFRLFTILPLFHLFALFRHISTTSPREQLPSQQVSQTFGSMHDLFRNLWTVLFFFFLEESGILLLGGLESPN